MTDDYVHGYASDEQERLVLQAEHWRDELILSGTTFAPGTRLLEVGCGGGAVLAILGQAFPGVALARVDVEERQVEDARRYPVRASRLRPTLRTPRTTASCGRRS